MKKQINFIAVIIVAIAIVLLVAGLALVVFSGKQPGSSQADDGDSIVGLAQAEQNVRDFVGNASLDLTPDRNLSSPRGDSYSLRSANGSFYVNQHTGTVEMALFYDLMPCKGNSTISMEQAKDIALRYAHEKYPQFDNRNMTLTENELLDHGDGGKEYTFAWQGMKEGVYTLSAVAISVNPITGAVYNYLGWDMPVTVDLKPAISQADAIEIAKRQYNWTNAVIDRTDAKLGVYPIDRKTQRLVWATEIHGMSNGTYGFNVGGPVVVDALNGSVLFVDYYM